MAVPRKIAAAFILILGLSPAAGADPLSVPVIYTFSFNSSGLTEEYGFPVVSHPSFSFSFVLPQYVTVTGFQELPGPITIGRETITHFGTNSKGTWLFGNGVYDDISEGGWQIVFDTLTFAFTRGGIDEFFTRPTHLSRYSVAGATSYLADPQLRLIGSGSVSVEPVPEPGTLLLVGAGALLLARRLRRAR